MYSCSSIFLSGYNHYSNYGQNQEENPEVMNIPNKVDETVLKLRIRDRIAKHFTSLLVPLPILFLQVVPSVIYKGIMLLPVLSFVTRPFDEHFYEDLRWLFLYPSHIPGWSIAGFGFLLFLVALTSMLKERGRLLTSGLYGKVRHPQYLGFIVMTWGISAVSVIWEFQHPWLALSSGVVGYFLHSWVVMSLAYVGLAFLEERYLLKKHHQEYKEYKENVPFLFPVPHPRKIPEPIFDLGIIILFSFILQEIYPRIIQNVI
jgi:protein-S-isoprenylcysteine O-methyltransferase Ste14